MSLQDLVTLSELQFSYLLNYNSNTLNEKTFFEGEEEEGTLKMTYSDSSISLVRKSRPVEMKFYI